MGSQCCGARGAVGGSVSCARVSPQSWYWRWRERWLFTPPTYNPCRTWDSNPRPSGYKSNSLSIRPQLPFIKYIYHVNSILIKKVQNAVSCLFVKFHAFSVKLLWNDVSWKKCYTNKHKSNWIFELGFSLVLQLNLLSSWGDHHYVGLTGLEVVGKGGESVPVDVSMVTASPRDLNDLPEYSNDLRTLDKSVKDTFCIWELRWSWFWGF